MSLIWTPTTILLATMTIHRQFLQRKYYFVLKHFKEKPYFDKSVQREVTICISRMNLISSYMDSESHINEASV